MGCGASTLTQTEESKEGPEEEARLQRIQCCKESIKINTGRLFVFGVIQRANNRNRNGRVYPKELLKREADRYHTTHVLQHRALGELDHPNPNSAFFKSLTLENISHRVLDYYWVGEDLVGYVEVLSTPAGMMLRDLYLKGCQLGMSSRGWATLKEESPGNIVIQEDFELITFDFVSDPSTLGAFLTPVGSRLDIPPTLPLHMLVPQERLHQSQLPPSQLAIPASLAHHQTGTAGIPATGHCNVPVNHPMMMNPMQAPFLQTIACEDFSSPHSLNCTSQQLSMQSKSDDSSHSSKQPGCVPSTTRVSPLS